MDECIHGLGPIEACTVCNGRDQREAQVDADAWRMFPAKYEGHCAECNLPIRVGDTIAWRPETRPIHEDCAS
jgi:hypothetical protein